MRLPFFAAIFATAALALSACGDDTPATPTAVPTTAVIGTDVVYARQYCIATGAYLNTVKAALQKDPSLQTDEAKYLKTLAPIYADWANALAFASPPADVQKYHQDFIKNLRDLSAGIKSGTVKTRAELTRANSNVPEPSLVVRNRINAASVEVQECKDAGLAGFILGH